MHIGELVEAPVPFVGCFQEGTKMRVWCMSHFKIL